MKMSPKKSKGSSKYIISKEIEKGKGTKFRIWDLSCENNKTNQEIIFGFKKEGDPEIEGES